jgi:hypothetical protein
MRRREGGKPGGCWQLLGWELWQRKRARLELYSGMALPLSWTLAGTQTGTTLAPCSFSAYCCSHGTTAA